MVWNDINCMLFLKSFKTFFKFWRVYDLFMHALLVIGEKCSKTIKVTLFRKKRFEINFFVRRNTSKFAVFIEKENPHSFFVFHFEHF